jgi:ZIP family zinc transporter
MAWFMQQTPVMQALLATLFTWFVTALGAAIGLYGRPLSRNTLRGFLGFASGVMIAASFWSLLDPAIAMSEDGPLPAWLPAAIGFVLGGLFLWIVDRVLPHIHPGFGSGHPEGLKTTWQRSTLLVLAITLHNIPEGLAVGVAFGAAAAGLDAATVTSAIALAIGIGIQNFPEGAAVALPLRAAGLDRFKSFMWGQASGMVEPVAGVLGAALVLLARPLLPYALAFAAGAMIYVVAEELIPESHREGHTHMATAGVMFGFTVMMILDVALG